MSEDVWILGVSMTRFGKPKEKDTHYEVCQHLRGEARDRQIVGARTGLAHVIGLGSACGVHILERPYWRCSTT